MPAERGPLPVFTSSLAAHLMLGFLLITVHGSARSRSTPKADLNPKIVYDLKTIDLSKYLPVKKPADPGAAPGSAPTPGNHPRRGTSGTDPRVSIVSNPPHPDNFSQTILQPLSPPELKITHDLPLPNIVLGDLAPPPAAQPQAPPAPKAVKTIIPKGPSPQNAGAPAAPVMTALAVEPPLPAPRLEVPVAPPVPPGPKPAAASGPAPSAAPLAKQTPSDAITNAQAGIQTSIAATTNSPEKLVSLSLTPTPLTPLISVPPGNRAGQFTVTPMAAADGSPGGESETGPETGRPGNGTGGDESLAAGPDGKGGNGAQPPDPKAIHSVSGDPAPSSAAGGALTPLPPEKLVFKVDPDEVRKRRSGFVINSGPGGGGGLRVYGVLKGARVYTVYLPMPGRNWILQFAAPGAASDAADHAGQVQVHIEAPILPPSAIDQFDFHRPPLPEEKANQMIVLQGTIETDGSVKHLSVLQGLDDSADKAALAAFARWSFTPALRSGAPVAVEILVGVPGTVPGG